MYGARKPLSVGVNASLGVEPQAHAQATVNNTVIVNPSGGEGEIVSRSAEIDSRPEAAKTRNTVDELLLEIYSAMLLYQNKPLLANVASKNSIIITKEDLEKVISAKSGKSCSVTVREEETGCLAKSCPIKPIESIRIFDDNSENDFKVASNSDYIELMNVYHLSLKYVVV